MPSLLAIDDLHYAYGARVAVAGATLTIEAGECFGLLGPNGAGKTTLLSCIAGLRAARRGAMQVRGAPYRPHADPKQRAVVGLVPQELALYEDLTARENLEFFARVQGVERGAVTERTRTGLALAGLEERADDRVASFSGGMKRRLNLAIGDLHEPALLLLDEPTVGVDPQSRNHIFEALQALVSKGRTLLYTTHYMEEAERLCARVAIMNEGHVLDVGRPRDLAARAGIPDVDLEAVFLHLTGRRLRDEA